MCEGRVHGKMALSSCVALRLIVLKAWWHAQRDFFWNTHPQPTPEDKMPKREASHELDMKRKRQAERGQRQDVSLSVQLPPLPCAWLRMSCTCAKHQSQNSWPAKALPWPDA